MVYRVSHFDFDFKRMNKPDPLMLCFVVKSAFGIKL